MAKVMVNAPKLYTIILDAKTRLCEAMKIPLTLDRFQSVMTRFLRIEHRDSDNESGSDTKEEGQLVPTVLGRGKRKCFKCGKSGYIAKECRSGGRSSSRGNCGCGNGDRGFNGKCNNCGKQCHKKDDCWKLEENNDKGITDIRLIQKSGQ